MPTILNFDTGSDLDDFVKGSDESESEPELSESEAEYQSSSDEETRGACRHTNGRMRVTRRARPMHSYVDSSSSSEDEDDEEAASEEEVMDDTPASEVDEDDEADDESDVEELAASQAEVEARESDGDDSEVDDNSADVPLPVTTMTVRRRHAKAPRLPPSVVPALMDTPSWYRSVTDSYFSRDSGIRPFAHSNAVGQHWTPTPNQRVRVGDVRGENAFYAGKEGVVLGRSLTRLGKWRVTVHGSALETALHGETGVAFHSSDLTPITSLKLHLNTMRTADLPVLRVLVTSVTFAMVRTIRRARPFKNWPDLRKRVPAMTDVTAVLLKDLCAVNMSSTNTTWRAFEALGNDYATQLTKWSEMSVNQRLDARDNASEVIEAEKAERQRAREHVRVAMAAPEGEPRAQRPRRAAAIAADAIGYREEDAWRLRMLEADAWEAMQDD